jgi:hypothetical protein
MVFLANATSDNVIKLYLKVINSLLNLTHRELDILETFVLLDINWTDNRYKNIIDAFCRKHVMKQTYIIKANLSKCIKIFKEKNILVEHETGMWSINPSLLPSNLFKDDSINIEFTIKIEK